MTIQQLSSPARRATAFVSYAREDKTTREEIVQLLDARGVDLVGDWQLRPGPRYQPQLHQLIDGADAFVLIVTPHSVSSVAVREELVHAETRGKRIVPLLVRDGFDEKMLRPSVASAQWAYFRTPEETEKAADDVTTAINTDWELADDHSWLLKRANEWRAGRGGLLRGGALKRAEAWLPRAEANPLALPKPSPEITSYVEASRRGRVRREIALLLVLLAIAIAVPAAVWLRNRAGQAERDTEARRQLTEAQALEQKGPEELEAAVRLALEAQQQLPTVEGHTFLREKGQLLPRLIKTIELPNAASFAFSADGARYVTAGLKRPIEIRDARTHRVIRTIVPPSGVLLDPIAFGSDSQTVWAFGSDGWLRRWRPGGVEEKRFEVNTETPVLSSDGRYLVTSDEGTCCDLWDTGTGERLPFESQTDDPDPRVSFSADGRVVAMGEGTSEYFVIRNIATGERHRIHVPLNGRHVVLSANGTRALGRAEDGRVVDFLNDYTIPDVQTYSEGELAISPSGRAFAAIDEDVLRVWTIGGRELVRRVLPNLGLENVMFFSPDERMLVVQSLTVVGLEDDEDGALFMTLSFWDVDLATRLPRRYGKGSTATALSPDGTLLAVADDHDLRTVRIATIADLRDRMKVETERGIWRLMFSPDAKRLLLDRMDGRATEWVLGRPAVDELPSVYKVNNVAYSGGDGSRIVIAHKGPPDDPVRIDGNRVYVAATGSALSRLGSLLALSREGEIKVVRTDDGLELARTNLGGEPFRLYFSPGDRYLIGLTNSPTVVLWDWRRSQPVELSHDGAVMWSIAFDPDGEFVALGAGSSVSIWRLADAREVARIGTSGKPAAIRFIGSSLLVASDVSAQGLGSIDTQVQTFRWRAEDLRADICAAIDCDD